MSKCGGHWEWSLPGSLSLSVVLLHPTPSQWDGSAILRGYVSRERYTVSNVEGRETNLHRRILHAPGIEPGAAAWQAHTLPLALLQPFKVSTYLCGDLELWVSKINKTINMLASDATFPSAAGVLWNNLPLALRQIQVETNFKTCLADPTFQMWTFINCCASDFEFTVKGAFKKQEVHH